MFDGSSETGGGTQFMRSVDAMKMSRSGGTAEIWIAFDIPIKTASPQSDEHLTTATTMYREMGMTYWLEKVAQDVKELS
jgi:hypothetical protein